ncbi:hypothetical protein TSOC_002102, partial [Tetrabaena socialis]
MLCSLNAILTAENCIDGIDNDGDGLVDALDPDCWRCGNRKTDPDEECDDGNVLEGDGCSSICMFQDFPPPSLSPSPPPPPPTNGGQIDYCLATPGGCATCAGKCPTIDNYGKRGSMCRLPNYLHGAIPDSTICRNNLGSLALQTSNVTTADADRTVVGTATIYRTIDGFIWGTVQMQCPYLIWSPGYISDIDRNTFMLLSYTLNGVITVARVSLIRARNGQGDYVNDVFGMDVDMLYSCYSFGFDLQRAGFGSIGCTPLSIDVQMSVRSVFATSSASSDTCITLNEKNTQTDPGDNGGSFTAKYPDPPSPPPRNCPQLSSLPPNAPLRIWINNMPVAPATGPSGLADQPVVFTTLRPACAIPTTTITLQSGNGTGTFRVGTDNKMMTIPSVGIDTLDVDVSTSGDCDDHWVVIAIVVVASSGDSTPPIPPAACPCWMRAAANGTCPGIKVPILLETLGNVPNGQSVMQCVDPANYDIFTGRMAYSYCWRYTCLPDVFSTTSFKATCTDLDRWNIKQMDGKFLLDMQRTDGVHIKVTGKPKNPDLPPVVYTEYDDDSWITLPEGGFGNFTFEYIIPPGFDDLSAAVVMDASCACPLLPEETEGGVPGVLCNSTYATMTAQLVNDSSVTFKQCVSWPNYDILTREMAWSHCWRYDCLPRAFYGQAYTVSINEVSKHNIHDIPAADFELLTFVAPFGMRADVTLNYVDKVEEYNSTVGSLVIQGRKQTVNVRSMIDNLTISYYLPAVWGLDGLAAAVVLRMVPGSEMPMPPSPPDNPPSPPSPPAIPASAPRVLITADFMILGNLDVSKLGTDSGVTHSGYYVSIPVSFYDFKAMKDCSDDSKDALRLQIAKAFSVDDPSTVFVSCRFAVPSTGEPILRRVMRAMSRLLLGPSPVVESNIIVPAGIEFASAMTAGCTALTGTLSGADCAASKATTKPKITVTQTLPVSQKDACSTGDAVSDGSASIRSVASSSGSSLSSSSVISTGCTATVVQGGSTETSGGGNSSPSPSPSPAPSPAPSSSKSGLSVGIIAGIAAGAVGGVVILALVGIMVKNKMSQRNVTYVDPSGRTRTAKRWRTYSMQQQADAQLAGRGPVPGAAGGGPGVGVSTY